MNRVTQNIIRITAVTAGVAALAGCATPPPPPPPPPPPVAEVVPFRPLPPHQSPYVMEIPAVSPMGVRQTVNVGLSDDERVWHFRSAWNVAALNCLGPANQPTLDGYSKYIKSNVRALKGVNDRIDQVFQKAHSGRVPGIRAREVKMTSVYNYFALPPARARFCQTALDISQRYLAEPTVDPLAFAQANFALFEGPFEEFFVAYEQYKRDASAWDATYGPRYGASQPGYVATQKVMAARAASAPVPTSTTLATAAPAPGTMASPAVTTTVVDPITGAKIPVVPVDNSRESVPVVQPVATKPGKSNAPKQ